MTSKLSVVHAVIDTPVGGLTLVGHDDALCGVYFPEHVRRPDSETFGPRDDEAFADARRQLTEYFAGDRRDFDLELAAARECVPAQGLGAAEANSLRRDHERTANWPPPSATRRWPARSGRPTGRTRCPSSSRATG